VYRGADGSFNDIQGQLARPDFDGAEAVNFIIQRANAPTPPVGAAAGRQADQHRPGPGQGPGIASKVRIVWLGSNYPEPGEYNQVNDEPSLNYILDTGVAFEIALVRYGKPSGTDAVRATLDEIRRIMPGKGPACQPGGQGTARGRLPPLWRLRRQLVREHPASRQSALAGLVRHGRRGHRQEPRLGHRRQSARPDSQGRKWVARPGQPAPDHPVGEL
jgi:hypothetical protein